MTWQVSVDAGLGRLEGAVEGLHGSVDSLRRDLGVVAVVAIAGFAFLGLQLNRLDSQLDRIETAVAAIPARLSEEFRSMRAEMAAQTSAIANSITAVRQAQPPPPQVIVIPAPQPSRQPGQPKP